MKTKMYVVKNRHQDRWFLAPGHGVTDELAEAYHYTLRGAQRMVAKEAPTSNWIAVPVGQMVKDAKARRALISAAPELLEVAKMAREYLLDPGIRSWLDRSGYMATEYGRAVVALGAAIAKAEGVKA